MRRKFGSTFPWQVDSGDPVLWLLFAGRLLCWLAIVWALYWIGGAAWWRLVDDQHGTWSGMFGHMVGLLVGVLIAYLLDTCARTQGERTGADYERDQAERDAMRAAAPVMPEPPAPWKSPGRPAAPAGRSATPPPPPQRRKGAVVMGRQGGNAPAASAAPVRAAAGAAVVEPHPAADGRQAPAGVLPGPAREGVRDLIVDLVAQGDPGAGMAGDQLGRLLEQRGHPLSGVVLRRELWRLTALELRVTHRGGRYWPAPVSPEGDPFPGISGVLLDMVEASGEVGLSAADALGQLARYGVGDVPRDRVAAELRRLVADGGIGQEPGGPYLPVSVAMVRDSQDPL